MAGEFLSAKTSLKIGSQAINGCFSTPDMGAEPSKVDVSSFDTEEYKEYIAGLSDPPTMNFDFYDQTTNFTAAQALDGKVNTCELTYPDGSGYSWSGTHRTFKLAASVDDTIKFRVACVPNGKIATKTGTATAKTTT